MLVPLLLALMLSVVHVLSEHTVGNVKRYYAEITSFSAGIFITYLLLEVLPVLSRGIPLIGRNAYLFLLLGFVVFHLAEKYAYQHVKDRSSLLKDLSRLHIAGFIANSFVAGFALVLFFEIETGLGILIFVPFALHALSSAISVRDIHRHFRSTMLEEILLSLSPLFGAVTAFVLGLHTVAFYITFSFVTGILLYIVVRDLVPSEEKGKPLYFVFGMALALVLIAIGGIPPYAL
jgi:zinc transporter ZupT